MIVDGGLQMGVALLERIVSIMVAFDGVEAAILDDNASVAIHSRVDACSVTRLPLFDPSSAHDLSISALCPLMRAI